MATSFAERDTATVNAKGQITIPKHLRDELALATGDEVRLIAAPGNRLMLVPRNTGLEDLFGSIKSPYGRPLTLEELENAAADGWAFGEPDDTEALEYERGTDARAA
ncbi:MAG: AbrB/MazE/SpoVT family DNA-binding domain-containing protein [Leucobacter sp.]|nr:AbrB/MazE/SpoVT family DNA-binding domain-containing protein [Leucobacter sp.]